ncbi:retrovirus-related pol polyprotein from transposon TNT 1-94 [Tanacetum coccineum]|uniref:Retrovirus-related pol polyprotein from transposon TNT 1-94 n=1 Tax=Tanacetum coccineum TaxID=301880 RepID=A0ABQ5CWJ5_9ASTR
MNMLNRNGKTSFVKPEFLKKAQRENPRLYDIGCYNDNLALMLAPESDETIRLAQESRSKLSVECCKEVITRKIGHGFINLMISSTIETNLDPQIHKLMHNTDTFLQTLKEEMVDDLRYFNSLEQEQNQEQLNNDKVWKQKESTSFRDLNVKYFEIQDLKAQLQDKGIAISELKKLIEKIKGKYVETKFEKPSVIQQPNAFKSQRQSILGVTLTTSVSRPQLKSNQLEDRVMHNNSQRKKQEVEDYRRNFKFSNNKTSCVLNDNHDMCVLHYINGVNSRTKQLIVVPISTREPERTVNQYVATPLKRTVAAEYTNQKPRSIIRKNMSRLLVEIILFIVDSGCSKHMTGNLKLLSNFVEKFLGTVKFGNDQIAPILGYGDLVQENITIKRVYYVEGLNHNLFSVGQFCDEDLEVAFWKSTCYIRDLKGNDLLTGSRDTDLYSITLQDITTPNLICLMAKASSSQAWLWHGRLSHLNFDTINLLSKYDIVTGLPKLKFFKDHLCSSCELGKAKCKSFKTKTTPSSKRRLQILHMDLCGPMRVESINGTKFLNKTLHAYFAQEGIEHQTSTARTPKRNGIVERRNRTLVEAARTMLSAAKVPLFFWAEAIATTWYSTQSRAYRVYNKRTRVIVETIHVNFDELPLMASDHVSSDPVLQCLTTALEQDILSPDPQCQENVPQVAKTSFAVIAVDAPDQHQQQNITAYTSTTITADTPPLNIQKTHVTTSQAPTQAPTVTATENINQVETQKENTQVNEDEFIKIFSTTVHEQGDTSSQYVDSSNMHTFYQRHPFEHL